MKKLLFLAALIPAAAYGIQRIPSTQVNVTTTNHEVITLQDYVDNLPVDSDFPLEKDADFANHAATNVSYIHLNGSTNKITTENDILMYGGQKVGHGAGFPLEENADFADFAATNINYIHLNGSTNTITTENNILMYGGKKVGQGTGFPLESDADFANYAATNVSYIHLNGSTNTITTEDGFLMYGGQKVGHGAGFPLEDDADFGNYGAENINYLKLSPYEGPAPDDNMIYFEGGTIHLGNIPVGSLASVWGPSNYLDQTTYVTNHNASTLAILPAPSNANIRLMYSNSVYYLQAFSAIEGPRGADGIGNVIWAGPYFDGMIISNENTWVNWDGSLWTRLPSQNPVHVEPGTKGDTNWVMVISKGNDGIEGKDGLDGVGLHFVEWSTNLLTLTPDMLISYDSYLLMITNTVETPNPGIPVVDKILNKAYKIIVRPGIDGSELNVYTNMTFIFEFDPNVAVPAHTLVVYKDYLWYAKQDYIPESSPPPSEGGPFWAPVGKQGIQGPPGANGIGNLRYVGEWSPYRTNELNDIVRYQRSDGRYDWYRAKVGPFVGFYPDRNPDQWSKEITSGVDANVIEWTFVDGEYDHTRQHVNELYRDPSGKVYYSVGTVPEGLGYAPGRDTKGFWRLFVKDGTSVAGENGLVWRGEWEKTYDYAPGDMVTWNNTGGGRGLFVNIVACNGLHPSDTDYWMAIADGLQGLRGPAGKDGEVTNIYVTNITTYAHADIITNIYNITNDSTSTIVNINDRSEIYNEVAFNDEQFRWNYAQGAFSLTENALGVSSINNKRGNITLQGKDNIKVSNVDNVITISSDHIGLVNIPLNITETNSIDNFMVTTNVDALIFDGGAGFAVVTNNYNQLVITGDIKGSVDPEDVVGIVEDNDFTQLTLGGVTITEWSEGGGTVDPDDVVEIVQDTNFEQLTLGGTTITEWPGGGTVDPEDVIEIVEDANFTQLTLGDITITEWSQGDNLTTHYEDDTENWPYALDNSKYINHYFEYAGTEPEEDSYGIIIPASSPSRNDKLTLYLHQAPSIFFYYDIETNNIVSKSYPKKKFWLDDEEDGVWTFELKSPPGCTDWNISQYTKRDVSSISPYEWEVNDGELTGFNPSTVAAPGKIRIPSSVNGTNVFRLGSELFSNQENLSYIAIPETITSIGDYAFTHSGLSLFEWPASVTEIEDGMFEGCESLTNIIIPNTVTNMGSYLFSEYTKLVNVTIPSSVQSTGCDIFRDCVTLTNVVFEGNIESIGGDIFLRCENLLNVYFLEKTMDNVMGMDNYPWDLQKNCRIHCKDNNIILTEITTFDLKSYDIVGSLDRDWLIDNEYFSSWTEEDPESGEEIEIESWDKEIDKIDIGNHVTSIGNNTFSTCGLSSVIIPDSVASIGDSAFELCNNLTTITLGNSISYIGINTFSSCSNLTTINYTLNPDQSAEDRKQEIINMLNSSGFDTSQITTWNVILSS